MPPKPPQSPSKFYFFYGHRKPSQNRPVVRGGFFSNRQTLKPISPIPSPPTSFDLQKWLPDPQPQLPQPKTPSQAFFCVARRLSPLARYICDSFRKHRSWGPSVLADLHKLRRVPPNLVAEVLKAQTDPHISSKFFHWAGKQKGFAHNYSTYNAFAYCLNRAGRFRSADQVLELMNLQGKEPSEKQFEILIRFHADAGRGLRVYHVYQKMKKFGVKPRVFLYNRILDALVKTDHLDLALFVYDDFKKDGLKEECVTLMILAKGLCKAGRMDGVSAVLEKMREQLCRPDVFAYTAMIRVLVSEGNLDGCLRIWEEMRRDRVEPDAWAYTTLVSALCNHGDVGAGYELFQEMKEKGCLVDRAVYGSLIEAFVFDEKVGSACDLLKEMTESGYRPDLSIFNALIRGLCSAKRVEKGYTLFQAAVQEGLVLSFETINPLLMCYAEIDKMDDFCKLLDQMAKLRLSVMDGLSSFFSFMIGKGERDLKAVEVFQVLKEKGYCSVSIYNILIGALHKMGEVKRALSLFEELNDSHLEPDCLTYSSIIPCMVDADDLKGACSCYNKMVEMSWVPSVAAYCSLVKGLCRTGEINAAVMLVRDCLGSITSGPIEFKYTLTVLHACKSGNAEEVIEVLNEMMQQGCPPVDVIYCAIIHGLCKHGSSDEARKVFSVMRNRNLLSEANLILYEELLVDHLKTMTAGLVLSGLKFFGLESKLKLTRSLTPAQG